MAKALRASWRRWFERKKRKARKLSAHPSEALALAERALAKPPMRALDAEPAEPGARVGKLRQAWDDVQVLVRLVRAWARGDYRQVSRATMVLVLGAIVYFVSPIDAILDAIPVIGYLDDAAVIAWVVSEVRAELDAFRIWEKRVQAQPALASAAETT